MEGILLTADGGFLGPIVWVLGQIMNAIFSVLEMVGIHNIGITILLFTVIMYLLMLPMTFKQQKSSKLTNKMQPEIRAVQNKYKGKTDNESRMKMQQETQEVYDKYGVSMFGSCGQLLITMPIFLSLYKVIYAIPAYVTSIKNTYLPLVDKLKGVEGVEEVLKGFKNSARYAKQFNSEAFKSGDVEVISNTYIDCLNMASSKEWDILADKFPNISSTINETYDKIHSYNSFLGLNIGDTPYDIFSGALSAGAWILVIGALMIPFLAWFTQWLNYKLMPQAAAGMDGNNTMASSMKTMNLVMPIMSAVMCFSFPTGVGLYWIGGAVVRSVQQVLINKHIDKMDFDVLIDQNREKAAIKAKKRESRNAQIMENQAKMAEINAQRTKKINSAQVAQNKPKLTEEERKTRLEQLDKYTNKTQKNEQKAAGSLAAKANMINKKNDNK